ncbi:MAG: peptide chain release factor N(5)-glutamine methyltransferase, partial [Eubacteriales bacterium]|nr:peptide chain release factor N(5)-glutamine methyltransferase [Eubacteriales bacterium]
MTARDAFIFAKNILERPGIAEPEAKAKVIVSHVLGVGFSGVYGNHDVQEKEHKTIAAIANRCALGEPVEYVTGRAYFRHTALDVTNDVLIPRAETELVAGAAISLIQKNGYRSAIDMCTGSGCIAVSLATETDARVDACDISGKALDVAKHNAERNGVADRTRFFISDMFEDVTDTYDVIVCNPPYVSESEYTDLDESVRLFEPRLALVAGDGLDFFR